MQPQGSAIMSNRDVFERAASMDAGIAGVAVERLRVGPDYKEHHRSWPPISRTPPAISRTRPRVSRRFRRSDLNGLVDDAIKANTISDRGGQPAAGAGRSSE